MKKASISTVKEVELMYLPIEEVKQAIAETELV